MKLGDYLKAQTWGIRLVAQCTGMTVEDFQAAGADPTKPAAAGINRPQRLVPPSNHLGDGEQITPASWSVPRAHHDRRT
ncbi:hypothetical protein G7Y31_11415 [Corynebacterium lizhenjunii]|uniref:Uncharacterized protein n=1 Tax=Corynebacterium lizhenjunii TaxID=2709394 RepID=A0A7T0PB59_9CORY|nr:hypothetical protein [Corynebacterium lizhenjunii]QPK79080.1 hypothetical protein G7Y31_11415 [Corynebacterium lizhenjunii]